MFDYMNQLRIKLSRSLNTVGEKQFQNVKIKSLILGVINA